MRDRLQAIIFSDEVGKMVSEILSVYASLGLVLVMLAGTWWLTGRMGNEVLHPGGGRYLLEPDSAFGRAMMPERNGWGLPMTEVGTDRMIKNWSTKPGFLYLGVTLVLTILGTGFVVYRMRLWRLVELSVEWDRRTSTSSALSGTVDILRRQGVIYWSSLGEVVKGMEEYGIFVQPVMVRVW